MVLGELERGLFVFEGLGVEPVVEDGLHGAVRGTPDAECPSACGLESFGGGAVGGWRDADSPARSALRRRGRQTPARELG